MKNKLKQLIEIYYEAFEHNKPELLTNILSEDVYLRDWEIEKFGIQEVFNTSKEIMNLPGFNIEIVNEIYDGNYASIEIVVNTTTDSIKVIDIFEFSQEKIISIKAFKG